MDLAAAVRRLRGRVDSMIARAVISRVNDALKTQRLQLTILSDEVEDEVEHFQPYGVSFVPPEGAEAIVLGLSGRRSRSVAICANHPDKRPKGSDPGTGGLYTDGSWRVFIDESGVVHIGAESGADFVALAASVLTQLSDLKTAITNGVPVANDGGAALQASILAALASWPSSVAATNAKAT